MVHHGMGRAALVENPFGEDRVLVSGRFFTAQELEEAQEIVRTFPMLSRTELALTLCENLSWFTANGEYKVDSARKLLHKLESSGLVIVPPKRGYKHSQSRVSWADNSDIETNFELVGRVSDFEPLEIKVVRDRHEIHLWNEYVNRYHVLGYKRPFGAHQRYFIISAGKGLRLGCLLFSASAWALAARDQWIGWEKVDRSQRLHLILNNSRFLLFPWVHVDNLASKVLSLIVKQIRGDWSERYHYSPVLLETFVDKTLYKGTCYRAANWLYIGETAGRGRMDRYSQQQFTVKLIYMYPLVRDFRACLVGEEAGR